MNSALQDIVISLGGHEHSKQKYYLNSVWKWHAVKHLVC